MNENGQQPQDSTLHERAERSMKRAFGKVVQQHRLSGHPIPVLRDGQIVWVPADQFEVTETEQDNGSPETNHGR